ncbi:uncharacterized protein MELLADRAFT_62726 [Melampsora larici-populina 98AG31]|uniref:Uncharacterized protein n=1 Tax=Melampsora larici-populina (strain 98AG31 / pathotype 3-4-7) TaxID=747676 RepID=F4RJZ8_MELLP|nr:uncharacterized protein MELLADRAFT_62726 [Melampsora larici-populina 98AG31]EGG07402.1 hypothetical protein MELLADRAFT_62726 [Melampsora larici-populina 98AG31]
MSRAARYQPYARPPAKASKQASPEEVQPASCPTMGRRLRSQAGQVPPAAQSTSCVTPPPSQRPASGRSAQKPSRATPASTASQKPRTQSVKGKKKLPPINESPPPNRSFDDDNHINENNNDDYDDNFDSNRLNQNNHSDSEGSEDPKPKPTVQLVNPRWHNWMKQAQSLPGSYAISTKAKTNSMHLRPLYCPSVKT